MFYYYHEKEPENPFSKSHSWDIPCPHCGEEFGIDPETEMACTRGQQSIISKLIPVDLDEMQTLYEEYRAGWKGVDKDSEPMTLEQFIRQQIQEGKDGK